MPKEKLAAKPPKMPKMPKSMGACVDLYHDTREERLGVKRTMEAVQERETFVKDYIINNVSKGEDKGAVGKRFKGIVSTDVAYQVDDWDAFYAHIKKTGEFDLLNRALNQAAVKERIVDQEPPASLKGAALKKWRPTLPPGIKAMPIVKLSVTKV